MDVSSKWADWYTSSEPHNDDIAKRMQSVYGDNINQNQVFWSEADTDMRYKVGDQSFFSDFYGNVPAVRNKKFYFNRIMRTTNMVTGYQRRNRKSTIVVGVEGADDLLADQQTKLLMYADNKAGTANMISDAFDNGSVTTGLNLVQMWLDHSHDAESGDIVLDRIAYNSFLIDPNFRRRDLSDCNFIWTRKWVSKAMAKRLLPGREDEIDKMSCSQARDGKFQFMAETYNFNMSNLLSYDEFYYLDCRDATYVVDVENGLSIEWHSGKDELKEYLAAYPQLATRKSSLPTVRMAIVVNGRTMYNGPNTLELDSYPFVPFLGYYEPEIPYLPWRCQGMVRGLRDAQYLYNRRRIIELDILESQIGSGMKYKPEALVNPEDVFMVGQGRGVAIKTEFSLDDVQSIMPPQVPPSMIQLSEMLGAEIQQISGVNEELLGSATDDKAGVLSMLRQGAGLTTLQKLFDNLDYAQKLLGEKMLQVINKNWSYGKIRRILNQEPVEQYRQEPHLRYFPDFDITIQEGVNTSTQRQMQFVQLLQLKELGVPVSNKDLIDACVVQNKKQMIENMEQEQQQVAQMEQQQAQAQIALLQAQIKNLEAQAVANQGLGMERASRIAENESLSIERKAKAAEDIASARLNQVKAIKELESIDMNQVRQLLDIMTILKAESNQDLSQADDSMSNNSVMM